MSRRTWMCGKDPTSLELWKFRTPIAAGSGSYLCLPWTIFSMQGIHSLFQHFSFVCLTHFVHSIMDYFLRAVSLTLIDASIWRCRSAGWYYWLASSVWPPSVLLIPDRWRSGTWKIWKTKTFYLRRIRQLKLFIIMYCSYSMNDLI